ncbi:hypothetical protein BSKO_08011 [Bryopsis sp. KO-2023]|nr:hypothetical protein BSKO_08011 [Bryopsis sp. KO-2023]
MEEQVGLAFFGTGMQILVEHSVGESCVSMEGEPESDAARWAREMRLKFSPKQILFEDGAIKQEFFKPTKVVIAEQRSWGNEERALLYQGLESYGVGSWKEISKNCLPKWNEQELRAKAARLLGSQSVARYTGKKMTKETVDSERAKNKEIGERLGCWKGGVLVDEKGKLKDELKRIGEG